MCRTNIVAYTHTLISVWCTFWVRSMHTHWAQTREKEDERHCTICIRTTHACNYIHIRDNECSCCAAAAAIFRCAFTFELFVHSFTRVSLDTFISFNLSRFFPCQVNARTHTHTYTHAVIISPFLGVYFYIGWAVTALLLFMCVRCYNFIFFLFLLRCRSFLFLQIMCIQYHTTHSLTPSYIFLSRFLSPICLEISRTEWND